MNGNICPKCGEPVMSYWRFLKEAEPYKLSKCGSCGVELRRSPKVYLFLLGMIIILVAVTTPMFLAIAALRISPFVAWATAIVWLLTCGLFINHLSWRFIGWVAESHDPAESRPLRA